MYHAHERWAMCKHFLPNSVMVRKHASGDDRDDDVRKTFNVPYLSWFSVSGSCASFALTFRNRNKSRLKVHNATGPFVFGKEGGGLDGYRWCRVVPEGGGTRTNRSRNRRYIFLPLTATFIPFASLVRFPGIVYFFRSNHPLLACRALRDALKHMIFIKFSSYKFINM